MRVLITGATGYLGTAMQEAVPPGVDVTSMGHTRGQTTLDVTDPDAVGHAVEQHRPDTVVHLAAVSMTTSAAENPVRATAVNEAGARTAAAATGRSGIRLVALSSDVVFDGTAAPYNEDALPTPINAYGESKLAGETAILAEHPTPLILRTTVMVGRNRADRYPFSEYLLEQARRGQPVRLFENERRSFYPVTLAAAAVWECATTDITGILHIATTSSASRFEFGQRLLKAAGFDPDLAIRTAGPPDRPSDLTLSVDRARSLLNTPMPTMDEVIAEVQRDLGLT